MSDDSFDALQSQIDQDGAPAGRAVAYRGPEGLGGWLILIGIGLVVSIVQLVNALATTYFPIFTQGQWQALTTPGSPNYHPLWAPALLLEVLGNLLFFAMATTLLVMYFCKSRWFPRIFIAYILSNFVFVTLDHFLSQAIPAVAAQGSSDTAVQIFRSFLSAAIWAPYMLVSTRVKNTFREAAE